jgi:hypothetical protein
MRIAQIAGAIVLYATGYLFIDMAIVGGAMVHASGREHRTHSKARSSRASDSRSGVSRKPLTAPATLSGAKSKFSTRVLPSPIS